MGSIYERLPCKESALPSREVQSKIVGRREGEGGGENERVKEKGMVNAPGFRNPQEGAEKVKAGNKGIEKRRQRKPDGAGCRSLL